MPQLIIATLILCFSFTLSAQKPSYLDQATFESIEELSLDEILTMNVQVVTSGKQAMPLAEVPEALHILTEYDIRRSGATNLGDLMRLIPGMEVSQLIPGQFNITSRSRDTGSSTNETLILIDSRPTYSLLFRTTTNTALPLNLEEIERIEVMVGPGSTLYGSNAVKGVINIITKKPTTDNVSFSLYEGAQLNNGHNTFFNLSAHASASKRWNDKVGSRLGISYTHYNPWEEGLYPVVNTPFTTHKNANITFFNEWQPSATQALLFRAGFVLFDSESLPTIRQKSYFRTFYADAEYTHTNLVIHNDYLSFRIIDQGGQRNYDLTYDPNLEMKEVYSFENQLISNIMYRFPLGQTSTTTLGIDFSQNFIQEEVLYDEGKNMSFASMYALERIKLFNKLILTVGARAEADITSSKTRFFFLPQGSLVYLPHKKHSFRLSARKALNYNSPFERFGHLEFFEGSLHVFTGNPDLDPLQSTSVEFGYQWFASNLFDLKLDLFFNRFENTTMVGSDPSGRALIMFVNAPDGYNNFGGELSLHADINRWFNLKVAYAYSYVDQPYYEDIPPNPQHKAYITWSSKPLDNLEIDWNFYFQSFYQAAALVYESITVNPIELLNLRISYQLTNSIAVFGIGYNLLNIDWDTTFSDLAVDSENHYPDAEHIGRRFMLGIHVDF